MDIIEKKRRSSFTPIVSYGIILYYIDAVTNKIYFLLYQRRDTYEYMDFLRGMWTTENHVINLFRMICNEERQRLLEYTFRELWDDLWIHHDCKIYKENYLKAKRKYDFIKNKIPELIENIKPVVDTPPWGFPKGKKNGHNEDPLNCALREFSEETRMDTEDMTIITNTFFTENFKGSNNKNYITHYYIAETSNNGLPDYHSTGGCIRKKTLSDEANDIRWVFLDHLHKYLNEERINIVKNVLNLIEDRQKT